MKWSRQNSKDAGTQKLERDFLAFRPTLLRYLATRFTERADAQDIAQEAFLRLRRISDPGKIKNPQGYFFQIVRNLAAEHLVKRGASIEDTDLDALIETGRDGDGNAGQAQLEARAAMVRLNALLETLPPLYGAVLILRKRDGYSHAEIAEQLGITPATARAYLSRALARCREQLDKN